MPGQTLWPTSNKKRNEISYTIYNLDRLETNGTYQPTQLNERHGQESLSITIVILTTGIQLTNTEVKIKAKDRNHIQ